MREKPYLCTFFEKMMKKLYIQPTLEILPVGTMVALCVSGEQQEGLGGGDSGENPWTEGRSPHRAPVF